MQPLRQRVYAFVFCLLCNMPFYLCSPNLRLPCSKTVQLAQMASDSSLFHYCRILTNKSPKREVYMTLLCRKLSLNPISENEEAKAHSCVRCQTLILLGKCADTAYTASHKRSKTAYRIGKSCASNPATSPPCARNSDKPAIRVPPPAPWLAVCLRQLYTPSLHEPGPDSADRCHSHTGDSS